MKNILVTLISLAVLLIHLSSCSRNASTYGPNGIYVIETPEPQPPVVEPPPTPPTPPVPTPPIVYPRPGERVLDFLVSVDISKESVSWLPAQTELLANWLQALTNSGFNIKVGFVNSAGDKDGVYDFSIINSSVQTFVPGDNIKAAVKLVLENPVHLKEGHAMQFLSLEKAVGSSQSSTFFRNNSDHIFYSLSTSPESQDKTTPSPFLVSQHLYRALIWAKTAKTRYITSVVSCKIGSSTEWMNEVARNYSMYEDYEPISCGCMEANTKKFAYPIEKIFGPDAVPKS